MDRSRDGHPRPARLSRFTAAEGRLYPWRSSTRYGYQPATTLVGLRR